MHLHQKVACLLASRIHGEMEKSSQRTMIPTDCTAEARERGQAATKVAQTSKSAVSRVSKPAAGTAAVGLADLEVGDTAGLETCATKFGGFCLFWPAHALA
jgi:hypothetical protein